LTGFTASLIINISFMYEVRLQARKCIRLGVIAALLATIMPSGFVRAQLDACSASVSPQSSLAQTQTTFTIGLFNSGSQPITWIQVTRPFTDDYVTLQSASANGWQADVVDANTVVFSGGSLVPGASQGFDIQVMTGTATGSTVSWDVQASDDNGGTDPLQCSGDTSFTLTSGTSPITISNIGVSGIGPTSVTIYWGTDVAATTQLNYGQSGAYGQSTPLDSQLRTAHSVTLTGLTPNTTYYYQIVATTPNGGYATADNNTFLTAVAPPPTPPPVIIINGGSGSSGNSGAQANVPGVIIQQTPTEHTPPTATFTTDLSKPFREAPLISGTATDNVAVARVEYSTDAGQNWLPVDKVTSKVVNGASVVTDITFQFKPILTEDGNYRLIARAIDSSGNVGLTTIATVVIDRLPPQLGPLQVSSGPEVLRPNERGTVEIVAGLSYRVTSSSVGGPTSLMIEATPTIVSASSQTFALTQDVETGLWNGFLRFKVKGAYRLTARALDGAGNRTTRQLLTLAVMAPGQVTDTSGKVLTGAKLTVYYREPASGSWVLWDAAPYNQSNPQTTNADGRYSLMLPPGSYYVTFESPGYHRFVSHIFRVNQATSVARPIRLSALPGIRLGSFNLHLPDISWDSHELPAANNPVAAVQSQTVTGKLLPDFNLPTTSGGQKRALDLLRKPTVLSMVTTWSPSSQAQLEALSAAQTNPDVNVTPVFTQEHSQLVSVYLATSGYSLDAVVDEDGVLIPLLSVNALPQHIFIDRAGHVKKVMVGVLSKDGLLEQLGGL
jgi:hypothetical protein